MKNILRDLHILIISTKTTHRSGLRKTLVDKGAQNNKIEAFADLAQASVRLLNEPAVNIIISDDDIDGSPLDLIGLHEKNNADSITRLFILLSADASPLFRSEFIVRGGNLIIEKPFTTSSFLTPFEKYLEEWAALTQDEKAKMGVEDALKAHNGVKAKEIFSTFKMTHSQPWYYSKGIIDFEDKAFMDAFNSFIASLGKKTDLKGLVQLVKTGVELKKYQELDDFVEKWIKHFPLYKESIPDITRVLLFNKKFHLLNEMNVDQKESKAMMSAGMVVASSYYLDIGNFPLSIEFAKKAIEFSGFKNKKKIVLKSMENLVQAGAIEHAQKIYENNKMKVHFEGDTDFLEDLQKLLQMKTQMV